VRKADIGPTVTPGSRNAPGVVYYEARKLARVNLLVLFPVFNNVAAL